MSFKRFITILIIFFTLVQPKPVYAGWFDTRVKQVGVACILAFICFFCFKAFTKAPNPQPPVGPDQQPPLNPQQASPDPKPQDSSPQPTPNPAPQSPVSPDQQPPLNSQQLNQDPKPQAPSPQPRSQQSSQDSELPVPTPQPPVSPYQQPAPNPNQQPSQNLIKSERLTYQELVELNNTLEEHLNKTRGGDMDFAALVDNCIDAAVPIAQFRSTMRFLNSYNNEERDLLDQINNLKEDLEEANIKKITTLINKQLSEKTIDGVPWEGTLNPTKPNNMSFEQFTNENIKIYKNAITQMLKKVRFSRLWHYEYVFAPQINRAVSDYFATHKNALTKTQDITLKALIDLNAAVNQVFAHFSNIEPSNKESEEPSKKESEKKTKRNSPPNRQWGGPYEILGLPRTATVREIRKKYLILAQLWHPDKRPWSIKSIEKEFNGHLQRMKKEDLDVFLNKIKESFPHLPLSEQQKRAEQELDISYFNDALTNRQRAPNAEDSRLNGEELRKKYEVEDRRQEFITDYLNRKIADAVVYKFFEAREALTKNINFL